MPVVALSTATQPTATIEMPSSVPASTSSARITAASTAGRDGRRSAAISSGEAVTTGSGSLPNRTESSGARPMPATRATTTMAAAPAGGSAKPRTANRIAKIAVVTPAAKTRSPCPTAAPPTTAASSSAHAPTSTWFGPNSNVDEPSPVNSTPATAA